MTINELPTGIRPMVIEQLNQQIGAQTILSVSGGRVKVHCLDGIVVMAVEYPMNEECSVRVFLEVSETYLVQRVRAGRVVSEERDHYFDTLGLALLRAAGCIDMPFGLS